MAILDDPAVKAMKDQMDAAMRNAVDESMRDVKEVWEAGDYRRCAIVICALISNLSAIVPMAIMLDAVMSITAEDDG